MKEGVRTPIASAVRAIRVTPGPMPLGGPAQSEAHHVQVKVHGGRLRSRRRYAGTASWWSPLAGRVRKPKGAHELRGLQRARFWPAFGLAKTRRPSVTARGVK